MNECQGNVQAEGGMDRRNRFYGYHPVRLQTVHLINKEIKTKVLKIDSHGNTTSSYIEVNRRKKWNQGKKTLWFVF